VDELGRGEHRCVGPRPERNPVKPAARERRGGDGACRERGTVELRPPPATVEEGALDDHPRAGQDPACGERDNHHERRRQDERHGIGGGDLEQQCLHVAHECDAAGNPRPRIGEVALILHKAARILGRPLPVSQVAEVDAGFEGVLATRVSEIISPLESIGIVVDRRRK